MTSEIRKRLKDLQKKYRYTNKDVAHLLNLTTDGYKNMLREKKGSYYFREEHINILKTHYGCTRDYLICESDVEFEDRNGTEKTNPISFSENEKKLLALRNLLDTADNRNNLNNLHYLLVEAPSYIQKNTFDIINSLATFLKPFGSLMRSDNQNSEVFHLIFNALNNQKPELTASTITFADAKFDLNKQRYAEALSKYLKIIYYVSDPTISLVQDVIDEIISLEKNWEHYPSELKGSFLDNLVKWKNLNLSSFHFPSECYTAIQKYLKELGINLQNRDEYFSSIF